MLTKNIVVIPELEGLQSIAVCLDTEFFRLLLSCGLSVADRSIRCSSNNFVLH
jgi:hypothetical protein